ncbi:MAG: hypothetical protein JW760_04655 [Spirochaetales bacterium]|nr:hypothetical protein [Spirochaetales bacterium]
MLKVFRPEVFQGNLRKKGYFEGWYFKHVSADLSRVLAFIPGVSLSGEDPHAFIQVIDGVSGETWYSRFPLQDFHWTREPFSVTLGENRFSLQGSSVHLRQEDLTLDAEITYDAASPFPRSLRWPGIMGPYSFVPFMECNHGVVSMDHRVSGKVELNDRPVNFAGGRGYIEKDWGSSFPEAWIWLQCNNFENSPGTSFMLSLAKIPWLGKSFLGFLSFLYYQGRVYRFATYNGSRYSDVRFDGLNLELTLSGGDGNLEVRALMSRAGELKAPSRGSMARRIKESIDSEVTLRFSATKEKEVFLGPGRRAGLEIIDPIVEMLKR